MSTITQFEELKIWQESRILANAFYDSMKNCNDYGFKDQIQRTSVSIMNNIAEGFERGSDKDFARFLYISKASAGEVRSMLFLGEDRGYIESDNAQELRNKYYFLGNAINNFIKYLNK